MVISLSYFCSFNIMVMVLICVFIYENYVTTTWIDHIRAHNRIS